MRPIPPRISAPTARASARSDKSPLLPKGARGCRKNRRVFPTKGSQSAARIICPSVTDKFHTGSLRGIFSHAQVARENDCNFSRLRTRTLRGVLTRVRRGVRPRRFFCGERYWVRGVGAGGRQRGHPRRARAARARVSGQRTAAQRRMRIATPVTSVTGSQ